MTKPKKMLFKIAMILMLIVPAFLLQCCDDDEPIVGITSEDFTACVGDEIQILGWGFSEVPTQNIVKFDDVQAEILLATKTSLTVRVPETSTSTVTVRVKTTTVTGPTFTLTETKYYIKFKADGVSKIFTVCNPTHEMGSECVWGSAWETSETFAFLRICNDHDKITAEILEGWNGDKLLFAGSKPIVTFGYEENGSTLHSEWATGTGLPDNGSEVNITSITPSSNVEDHAAYDITGNFTCLASTGLGDEVVISEGEFVVRVILAF